MSDELVWEAPPPATGRRSIYAPIIKTLVERPGQWARVKTLSSQSSAYNARRGFLKAAKDERFEATTGPIDGTSEYGVWARFRTREQMREAK